MLRENKQVPDDLDLRSLGGSQTQVPSCCLILLTLSETQAVSGSALKAGLKINSSFGKVTLKL